MKAIRWSAVIGGILASSFAWSVSVVFVPEDVADTGTEDLWVYQYSISGDLPTFHSVRIDFDATLYSPLSVSGASEGWFAEVGQSQSIPFPANGYAVFSPVSVGALLPKSFDVTVVRFARGPVAPQSFEVLGEVFNVLESGSTSPIPEPETMLLMAGGLSLVLLRRRTDRA